MSETAKLVRTNNKVREVTRALLVNGYTETGDGSKMFVQDTILVNVTEKTFKVIGTSEFIELLNNGTLKKYVKYKNGDDLIAEFAPIPEPEVEPVQEEVVFESAKPEPEPEPVKKKTTRKKKTEPKND